MTSLHTPGPWVASGFGFQVLTGDSWSTVCTLKGGAEWEDGRGKYEQEYEWQNQEANSLLIAAAPEMYDALKAVQKLIAEAASTGFNWKDGDWPERLFASQWNTSEAIRKAEGRERKSLSDQSHSDVCDGLKVGGVS